MLLVREIPFQFEDNDYKIKVFQSGARYTVRAFLGDAPANGYEYSVEETTNFDLRRSTGVSAVSHLIEMAQADVENRVWENYLAALEQLNKDAATPGRTG